MIVFKQICKQYQDKSIFTDFNLTIPCGAFLTIIGTSGSGKTTLLKMINGLVKPDSGTVLINDVAIEQEDIIQLRRKIGYAIQGNILFPHLSVAENIAYVPSLSHTDKQQLETLVKEKLALLQLPLEIADKYPHELSGGQQQRVGIARALAANPDILLMDEPFGAVDAITRHQLQYELTRLHRQENITIIFITHDIAEALKMGTHVLVLDNGQVQQFDTPEMIRQAPKNAFVKELLDRAAF